jgi:hypothetical protein
LTLSDARFEPSRVACPLGTSVQTLRLVFDLSAASGLPIAINRVSSAGVRCQVPFATSCFFEEGRLSISPSLVEEGTRAQIVATQQFTCGANGSPRAGAQLFFDKLFVNTSCGAAREIRVTNTLDIVL